MIKLSNDYVLSSRNANDYYFWAKIKGYEGIYEISILGVRSKDRVIDRGASGKENKKGKIKKPTLMQIGYLFYGLWDRNKEQKQTLHRLIAFHFIANFDPLKNHVNHKDGVKLNNAPYNLEWNTQAENNLHACRTGLRGTRHLKSRGLHACAKPVGKYSDGRMVKVYDCVRDAVEDTKTTVGYFIKNNRRDPNGFYWKFISNEKSIIT
jgi:hypothetical protein